VRLIVLWLVLLLSVPAGVRAAEPRNATVLALLTSPAAYDGQVVRVIGYCWLEFEGNALYLHEEDFVAGISENSVWLTLSREEAASYRPVAGGYAIVEGTFRAQKRGHLGSFGGSLERITRLQSWPGREPRDPFRFPVLVSAIAPSFPDDVCESTALGYDLTIDSAGQVADATPVPGFAENVPAPLARRSDEMLAVVKRWRYSQRGVNSPIRLRVGIVFLVRDDDTNPVDLLPEFSQDRIVVKRRPCAR